MRAAFVELYVIVLRCIHALHALPDEEAPSHRFGENEWHNLTYLERFLTIDEFHEHVGWEADPTLTWFEVLFIVKASASNARHIQMVERTWLGELTRKVYVMDNFTTAVSEKFQSETNWGAYPATRIALFLDHIEWERLERIKWVVLVYDTFMHLGHLFYFLQKHTPKNSAPVLFGGALTNGDVYDFDMPCGAMILNKAAIDRISGKLMHSYCPYVHSDQTTFTSCCNVFGVPLVHVPHMHCTAVNWDEAADSISFEKLSELEMPVEKLRFLDDNFPTPCGARKRYPYVWSDIQIEEQTCEHSKMLHLSSEEPEELNQDNVKEYFAKRWGSHPLVRIDRRHLRVSPGQWVFYSSGGSSFVSGRNIETFIRATAATLGNTTPWAFISSEVQVASDVQDILLSPAAMQVVAETGQFDDRITYIRSNRMHIKMRLPRTIHGTVSNAEGLWSIQEVTSWEDRRDLEAKDDERGFFRELLATPSTYSTAEPKDFLMEYLHSKDHITVIRDRIFGKREFRPTHAVYRSEDGFPTQSIGDINVVSSSTRRRAQSDEEAS